MTITEILSRLEEILNDASSTGPEHEAFYVYDVGIESLVEDIRNSIEENA